VSATGWFLGGRLSLRAGGSGGYHDGGRGAPEVCTADLKVGSTPPPISINGAAASAPDLWPGAARASKREVLSGIMCRMERQVAATTTNGEAKTTRIGAGGCGSRHSTMSHIG